VALYLKIFICLLVLKRKLLLLDEL